MNNDIQVAGNPSTSSGQASNPSTSSGQASNEISWWHWHKHLYNWVVSWADTRFGVLALIVLAITEPICVPIPADVLVIGLCLGKPKRSLKYGIICSLFSVLGGTIAFSLGLLIGPERVVHFFEQLSFGPIHLGDKAHGALELYQKYDFWAISISALTPVPYMLFSWLGGMAKVSLIKFVAVSLVFRTMRFGGEALLFYIFGQKARQLIEKYFNIATIVAIIILALLVFALKKVGHIFG
ncbi:MAG: DedA family protein [Planctomycetes bacterium]|nr:DedA family protein [Planctomycetota bacterium]